MKLETSNAGEIPDPSAARIAEALAQLPGGADSFAILDSGEQAFVQVAGSAEEGFHIEYREGGEDRHFEAATPPVTLAQAVDIFQRYAAGDGSWRSKVEWKPLGLSPGRRPAPSMGARLAIVLAIACLALLVFAIA